MPHYSTPEKVVAGFCLLMFIAMIIATLAQILFRYVLEISVSWTEEAARGLFVLSMLMSVAFAYREKQHIIVDFLFVKLPPRAQRWMGLTFNLLILTFLVFWVRGAWKLIGVNWGSFLITIPWFSTAYFYIWEVAAIGLLFFYVVLDTLRQVRNKADHTGNDLGL